MQCCLLQLIKQLKTPEGASTPFVSSECKSINVQFNATGCSSSNFCAAHNLLEFEVTVVRGFFFFRVSMLPRQLYHVDCTTESLGWHYLELYCRAQSSLARCRLLRRWARPGSHFFDTHSAFHTALCMSAVTKQRCPFLVFYWATCAMDLSQL